MSYQAQLRFKEKLVDDNLKRIGKIEGYEFFPAIGMEEPFRYRNKAQYPVGTAKDGSIVMGFYAGRTHSISHVQTVRLVLSRTSIFLL